MDVITSFVKYRFELSKKISDSEILDKVLFSDDIRKRIREENDLTLAHFQVIMGKLRKNKIIIDNKINSRFIPNIKEGDNSFQLVLYFDLK
jgi:hypothetical protein